MKVEDGGRVDVLGPTLINGEAPTPGQATMLAAIALAGEAGVELSALADLVWCGSPPRSARASLQNQTMRLRQRHGERIIECERGRYRLGFRRDIEIVEDIGGRLSRGEDVDLAEALAALSLWRGRPFEDIGDDGAVELERFRLDDLRAILAAEVGAARLRAGETAQAVLDLRPHAAVHLYSERIWELLIVALAAEGRTRDALVCQRSFLRRTEAELGFSPSQRFRNLGDLVAAGARAVEEFDVVEVGGSGHVRHEADVAVTA